MSCEMCRGLRGHKVLQDSLYAELRVEYDRAKDELERLKALFTDVCWYNFETSCRDWKQPWHISLGESWCRLHSRRYTRTIVGEMGEYPLYYDGQLKDAPRLPPEILQREIQLATDYLKEASDNMFAPYDYAPGGFKYEALVRFGKGASLYAGLKSNSKGS